LLSRAWFKSTVCRYTKIRPSRISQGVNAVVPGPDSIIALFFSRTIPTQASDVAKVLTSSSASTPRTHKKLNLPVFQLISTGCAVQRIDFTRFP
jgi:hypothetical protein